MKRVALIAYLTVLVVGCVNSFDRYPDSWVMVRDADTDAPIRGIPLIYRRLIYTPCIIGVTLPSREYLTNADGRAYVPSGKWLYPHERSGYERVPEEEKRLSSHAEEVIYVRRAFFVGDWGQPVNGLRCRLAVGRIPLSADEKPVYRLDLQNISQAPVNVLLKCNRFRQFGHITIDGVDKMGLVPPRCEFHNAYRTLEPYEIISAHAVLKVRIAEGKHMFIGEYSNTIDVTDESFTRWNGTPVRLWTGTDDNHIIMSAPVELVVESEKGERISRTNR